MCVCQHFSKRIFLDLKGNDEEIYTHKHLNRCNYSLGLCVVRAHFHARKNSRERARAQIRERTTYGAYLDFQFNPQINNKKEELINFIKMQY